MKYDQIQINSLGLGILLNFPQFCGEERAKEAYAIFEELKRLAALGRTLEEQHPQFDGIDDYSSLDGMDFSEGARLIKLGLAIDKVFELYPIILGASSATSKDPGPRAWKDAEELLEWYEKEEGE